MEIGLLAAFAGGMISFLSPCVLPLVPGYLSYISGHSLAEARTGKRHGLSTLGLSLCFVFGFSTVFVILGAGATLLGQWLLSYRYEANLIGGSLVIMFGLFMTDLLRFP